MFIRCFKITEKAQNHVTLLLHLSKCPECMCVHVYMYVRVCMRTSERVCMCVCACASERASMCKGGGVPASDEHVL